MKDIEFCVCSIGTFIYKVQDASYKTKDGKLVKQFKGYMMTHHKSYNSYATVLDYAILIKE